MTPDQIAQAQPREARRRSRTWRSSQALRSPKAASSRFSLPAEQECGGDASMAAVVMARITPASRINSALRRSNSSMLRASPQRRVSGWRRPPRALAGNGQFVLIVGDPGIAESRLYGAHRSCCRTRADGAGLIIRALEHGVTSDKKGGEASGAQGARRQIARTIALPARRRNSRRTADWAAVGPAMPVGPKSATL
jgi:hypothetical protein